MPAQCEAHVTLGWGRGPSPKVRPGHPDSSPGLRTKMSEPGVRVALERAAPVRDRFLQLPDSLGRAQREGVGGPHGQTPQGQSLHKACMKA